MCLGVPLQVQSVPTWGVALCGPAESEDGVRRVETSLLEQPPAPGDWLLVHVNIAIRRLEAPEARQIGDALLAVTRAAAGESFEHLLADLIDREPQLPPHLRPAAQALPINEPGRLYDGHTVTSGEVVIRE
jgi:hydrogenase expression/formation protein HypC